MLALKLDTGVKLHKNLIYSKDIRAAAPELLLYLCIRRKSSEMYTGMFVNTGTVLHDL